MAVLLTLLTIFIMIDKSFFPRQSKFMAADHIGTLKKEIATKSLSQTHSFKAQYSFYRSIYWS